MLKFNETVTTSR